MTVISGAEPEAMDYSIMDVTAKVQEQCEDGDREHDRTGGCGREYPCRRRGDGEPGIVSVARSSIHVI